jgi:hypothetical protein
MNAHADKIQENKNQSVGIVVSQLHNSRESSIQFIDNRPEVIAQRKLQQLVNNNPQTQQIVKFQAMANSHSVQQSQPIQKKSNNTGLPDDLKTGVENLSGISLDNVKVHYNSAKPAQLNAHAYAQGSDIHVAAGQEKHLPHEAWHVVQQAQGRVKPTMQMKQGIPVNDDAGLEHEADVMGERAKNGPSQEMISVENLHQIQHKTSENYVQRKIDINPDKWFPADKPGVEGYQAVAGLNSVTLDILTKTSKPEEVEEMSDPEIHKTIMDPSRQNRQRLTKMHLIRGRFGAPGYWENLKLGTALSNNFDDKSHYTQVEKPIADFLNQDKGRRMVEYKVMPYGMPPAYFQQRLVMHPSASGFVKEACPSIFVCGVQFFKTDDDINWQLSRQQVEHVLLDNGHENGGNVVP